MIKTTQQSRHILVLTVGPSADPKLANETRFPTPQHPRSAGLYRTAHDLVATEGVPSLWKGLGATVIRVFFGAGIYFTLLHGISDALAPKQPRRDAAAWPNSGEGSTGARDGTQQQKQLGGVRSFIAGVTARAAGAAIMSPVAVIKTRMEWADRRSTPYRNTVQGLAVIARTEGLASLYSGLLPTVARDAPFSGIYFAAYNWFKALLEPKQPVIHRSSNSGIGIGGDSSASSSSGATSSSMIAHNQSGMSSSAPPGSSSSSSSSSSLAPALRNFTAGVTAGAIATVITHPADVLKTRLQLKDAGGRFVDGRVLLAEAQHLLATEGVQGLLVGVTARIAKRAFSTAITWTLFEEAMRRSGSG